MYKLGADVGSTTIKVVMLDNNNRLLFSDYRRHQANITDSLAKVFKKIENQFGNVHAQYVFTGSIGMGLVEGTGIRFLQEVVAAEEIVRLMYPDTGILIDIGGEDSKIIDFNHKVFPEIRMNGNCAGGTGAFIDQMAALLDVSNQKLDELALPFEKVYSVASRCGVFAKTDVQNMLSKNIPVNHIASSIFYAVAVQVSATLLQGTEIHPKVLFSGGPLHYYESLRKAFIKVLGISEKDLIIPDHPLLLSAMGAALSAAEKDVVTTIDELSELLKRKQKDIPDNTQNLKPLFEDEKHFRDWKSVKSNQKVRFVEIDTIDKQDAFLGIDSGSTTCKIVLTNKSGEIVYSDYTKNKTDLCNTVKEALTRLGDTLKRKNIAPDIRYVVATGYGEELIRNVLNCDEGIVETLAHYKAAKYFNKDVSFILDIGGQDIKGLFIKDNIIDNIIINEACSSGCGSFVETFANSVGLKIEDFVEKACMSSKPGTLGSRCTVFMNSRVKQSLRQGVSINDISAGLAYSVVKNCFNKVLNIHDLTLLGDHIVVQGGTFRNDAILRAFEIFLGKEVIRPDRSELMGAWGCALTAIERTKGKQAGKSGFIGFEKLAELNNYTSSTISCKGCSNVCDIIKKEFGDTSKPGHEGQPDIRKTFFSGNRCEKYFSNQKGERKHKAQNIYAAKDSLLFERKLKNIEKPLFTIGIPRVLNMFENYPFWSTLFSELNIRVCLSSPSSSKYFERIAATLMSDNICFPAKLVHGHIFDLLDKKVDRIFYPLVRYEEPEYENAVNSYNCPVVTGYPDVIKSAVNPERRGVPYDTPVVVFNNTKLLYKECFNYVKQFGINQKDFLSAFEKAIKSQKDYKKDVLKIGRDIITSVRSKGNYGIILAGRPYHTDSFINHNIPQMIADMGIDVLSVDAVPEKESEGTKDVQVLSQWQYVNRLYNAAEWAAKNDNFLFVQLNSFGCGPDPIAIDEVTEILKQYGKNHTLLRIDEVSNTGPMRLRIRSLIESLGFNQKKALPVKTEREKVPPFLKTDRKRLILGPNISEYYSLFIESIFYPGKYNFKLLPASDRDSVEMGLKYVNNDICYPALLLIGDILKALKSGEYDLNNVAVALSETGGQCRASNYVPLLRKALVNAGILNVPVIAVSTTPSNYNFQPGFRVRFAESLSLSLSILIFTDALLKIYNHLVVRERIKGEAKKVFDKYILRARDNRRNFIVKNATQLIQEAIHEFSHIQVKPESEIVPEVGIVGEIFMKYNPYGNYNLEEYLTSKGVGVISSTLNTFFIESFVNVKFNHRNNIEKSNFFILEIYKLIEKRIDKYIDRVNCVLDNFHSPLFKIPRIGNLAKSAEKAVSLIHQYGEGWMLPGEIIMLAEAGIKNIICVQPFGCIANHIVAKGISKKLKELYPDLNLLIMDVDADSCEANMHNRLEYFIRNTQKAQKIKRLNAINN